MLPVTCATTGKGMRSPPAEPGGMGVQVVPPGVEDVAQAWRAALSGAEQQSVLSMHRKSLL